MPNSRSRIIQTAAQEVEGTRFGELKGAQGSWRNGEVAPGYGLERPARGPSHDLNSFWNNPNKNRPQKEAGRPLESRGGVAPAGPGQTAAHRRMGSSEWNTGRGGEVPPLPGRG